MMLCSYKFYSPIARVCFDLCTFHENLLINSKRKGHMQVKVLVLMGSL